METTITHKKLKKLYEENGIHTGYFVSPLQVSGLVREEEKVGRDYDIKRLVDWGIPRYIVSSALRISGGRSFKFYMWRHYNGKKSIVIHGYTMTDSENKLINTWFINSREKSVDFVNFATDIVSKI